MCKHECEISNQKVTSNGVHQIANHERARLAQLTSYISNLTEVLVQCHCANISNLL